MTGSTVVGTEPTVPAARVDLMVLSPSIWRDQDWLLVHRTPTGPDDNPARRRALTAAPFPTDLRT
jgi:hypothetical protein